MDKIVVTVKETVGNAEVGQTYTITKIFDGDTPIRQVYKEMASPKSTRWDIVIPLHQKSNNP